MNYETFNKKLYQPTREKVYGWIDIVEEMRRREPNAVGDRLLSKISGDDGGYIQGLLYDGGTQLNDEQKIMMARLFVDLVRFEVKAPEVPDGVKFLLGSVVDKAEMMEMDQDWDLSELLDLWSLARDKALAITRGENTEESLFLPGEE